MSPRFIAVLTYEYAFIHQGSLLSRFC